MKTPQHGARRSHRVLFGLFAFCAAIMMLAFPSRRVFADAVNIYDNAHVLDETQVYNEAFQLPNPVDIYTTKSFTGSTAAFDKFTTTYIGPDNSILIVINIDTVHRHLAIVGGTQVPLSNDQYAAAIQAFKDNFHNGNYTGATMAALQSLNAALPPLPDTNSTYPGGQGSYPGNQVDPGQMQTFTNSASDLSTLVPVFFGLVAIVFFMVIFISLARAASGRSRFSSVSRNALPRDATPWEAGARGTGVGEMAGYELGREEMERQNRERVQQQMFNNNNNGNIGGGSSGNF